MTSMENREKDKGTLFMALPDGGALVYDLVGNATTPQPADTITKTLPCKTSHTILLNVYNWLKQPQRFKAIIEVDQLDTTTSVKGLDYIDVPG